MAAVEKEFKNYGEFKAAIDKAILQERSIQEEIRSAQTRNRGLAYKLNTVNEKINAVEDDIRIFREQLESRERKK
jgi:predicted  nucleic acid-binding Zn-ribbon protein